jgi:hypothetical protein
MKKYVFLLLLLPIWVSAQNRQVVEATSGDDLSQKVSTQMQYLFPEFTVGDVFYKGHKGSGKLNYNMLLGEMQFMENNQVMALANVMDVVVLNIANRRFYPFNDREFTEELMSAGKFQLRVRRRGNVAQHSKKGAYGMDSSTSAITSYSSISSDNRQYNLTVEEKVLITLNCFYYLVGTNGKYTLIKNAKTFTKQFPAFREQVETFIKEHKTRFDNEADLKALLEYCGNLN